MENNFFINDHNIRISFTYTEKPEQKDFSMHMHDFLELYYFVSGSGTYVVEGSEYKLETGDIILLNSSEAHYFKIDKTIPYTRLTILFDRDIFQNLDEEEFLLAPFQNRENGHNNQYKNYDFESSTHTILMNHLLTNVSNKKLQTISYFLPLLYEIAVLFENRENIPTNNSLARNIIKYINNNYLQELSLDNLCHTFNISKTHLCRLFKNATGATINNYIITKRLIYSNELMKLGCLPTKAALLSGFNDYTVFYKAYKKRYHTAPSSNKKS